MSLNTSFTVEAVRHVPSIAPHHDEYSSTYAVETSRPLNMGNSEYDIGVVLLERALVGRTQILPAEEQPQSGGELLIHQTFVRGVARPSVESLAEQLDAARAVQPVVTARASQEYPDYHRLHRSTNIGAFALIFCRTVEGVESLSLGVTAVEAKLYAPNSLLTVVTTPGQSKQAIAGIKKILTI